MAERAQIENPARRGTEDIWVKCPTCKEIAFRKEVERNLNVCLKCGHHFRLTVEQRLAITADRGTWRELFAELAVGDPLEFTDTKPYREPLGAGAPSQRPQRRGGGRSRAASRSIRSRSASWISNFMGGSMGDGGRRENGAAVRPRPRAPDCRW